MAQTLRPLRSEKNHRAVGACQSRGWNCACMSSGPVRETISLSFCLSTPNFNLRFRLDFCCTYDLLVWNLIANFMTCFLKCNYPLKSGAQFPLVMCSDENPLGRHASLQGDMGLKVYGKIRETPSAYVSVSTQLNNKNYKMICGDSWWLPFNNFKK